MKSKMSTNSFSATSRAKWKLSVIEGVSGNYSIPYGSWNVQHKILYILDFYHLAGNPKVRLQSDTLSFWPFLKSCPNQLPLLFRESRVNKCTCSDLVEKRIDTSKLCCCVQCLKYLANQTVITACDIVTNILITAVKKKSASTLFISKE